MSQPTSSALRFPLIAKTFFGLEDVLADELMELGAADARIGRRMVSFSADQALLYRANLCCRTAVRILKPIARFEVDAAAADPYRSLYAHVQAIEWANYLRPEGTLAIDPVVNGRLLTNSLYASQVAKDAVVDWFRDRFGQRPSVDRHDPQLRINLHVSGSGATVYLDASGQSLHKRGYRRQTGEAPLNEVLAAGILRLAGWKGGGVLVDFLCGSGTIPIEAAMIVRNVAPGLLRNDLGYRHWLDFDAAIEAQVVDQVRALARPEHETGHPSVFGSDLDPAAIAAAGENAARAGMAGDIQFQIANFENLAPPAEAGTIVINPPYDERLKVAGVGAFYRRIGRVLASRWQGYTAWVLAGNIAAAEQFGLRPSASHPLRNGPIDCQLLKFELRGSASRLERQRPAPHTAESPTPAIRSSPAEALRNRLARMGKHWARWARRQEITCYRLYDCDLPEVPWTIDRYENRLHVVEHESPHGRSPLEHRAWFDGLVEIVSEMLDTPRDRIHAHPHASDASQLSGARQASAEKMPSQRFVVAEAGRRFEVDLGRRDDSGLSPEQRTLRAHLAEEAAGKRFLNLFGRSGSATVMAAALPGTAHLTVTVEPSAGLGRWARHNFELNSLPEPAHVIVEADPTEWLDRLGSQGATPFDLVLVAPPAGYHRRHDTRAWNPREEYRQLLERVRPLVDAGGKIYFASSVRRFRLERADFPWASIRDVSAQLLPADCRAKPRLRCWSLVRND